jgi:hypothetical protein
VLHGAGSQDQRLVNTLGEWTAPAESAGGTGSVGHMAIKAGDTADDVDLPDQDACCGG